MNLACAALTTKTMISVNTALRRQIFLQQCASPYLVISPSACIIGIPKPLLLLRYLHTVELVADSKNAIRKTITQCI